MKRTILTLVAGLLLVIPAVYAAAETGKAAPDFTLTDTNGKSHTLSGHKGNYVVLEWTNPECPFVKKHYDSGNMQSLQKEFTGKGVVWLSINTSAQGKEGYVSPEMANEWIKQKESSPTALLLDRGGKVGKLYGAKTTPQMFVINPEGVLIYQGAIDDNPSPDPSTIAEAKNYVRAALDQSMSGQLVSDTTTKSYGCSVKYGN